MGSLVLELPVARDGDPPLESLLNSFCSTRHFCQCLNWMLHGWSLSRCAGGPGETNTRELGPPLRDAECMWCGQRAVGVWWTVIGSPAHDS